MQYWSVWQKQHKSHEVRFSEPVTSLSSHPCQVKPFRLKISMLGVYHCLTQGARSSAEAAKSRGYAGPTGFQYTNWMCPLMTMVEMEHTFDPSAVACKKKCSLETEKNTHRTRVWGIGEKSDVCMGERKINHSFTKVLRPWCAITFMMLLAVSLSSSPLPHAHTNALFHGSWAFSWY